MAITPTAVDTSLTKRKSAGGAGVGAQMPLQMNLSGRMSPMDAMASTPSQFRCQHPQGIPHTLLAERAEWLGNGICKQTWVESRLHEQCKLLVCPSRVGQSPCSHVC